MKSLITRSLLYTLGALAVFALAAVAITIQRSTLIDGRLVCIVAAVLAIVAGVFTRTAFMRILRVRSASIAAIAGAALMWATALCLFYSSNYLFTRPGTTEAHTAEVSRKYTEQRYRYYRVGRSGGSRRVPYTAHCIDVELPNGSVKTYTLTASQYVKARRGQKVPLTIATGLYGIPVVKDIHLPGSKKKN